MITKYVNQSVVRMTLYTGLIWLELLSQVIGIGNFPEKVVILHIKFLCIYFYSKFY